MAIDLNTASLSELSEIEGLGPERAQIIVGYREENGGFESLDEVKELPGFSEDTIEFLRVRGVTAGATAGIEEELI